MNLLPLGTGSPKDRRRGPGGFRSGKMYVFLFYDVVFFCIHCLVSFRFGKVVQSLARRSEAQGFQVRFFFFCWRIFRQPKHSWQDAHSQTVIAGETCRHNPFARVSPSRDRSRSLPWSTISILNEIKSQLRRRNSSLSASHGRK